MRLVPVLVFVGAIVSMRGARFGSSLIVYGTSVPLVGIERYDHDRVINSGRISVNPYKRTDKVGPGKLALIASSVYVTAARTSTHAARASMIALECSCAKITWSVEASVICRTAMLRVQLSDKQWSKIELFLQSERGAGRPAHDDRRWVEAVLWWRRTGVPWRDLPSDFGPWKTVFNRFDRWAKAGKWQRLFLELQTDRDDEWHSLDSTLHRAHQHAAGGKGACQPWSACQHLLQC